MTQYFTCPSLLMAVLLQGAHILSRLRVPELTVGGLSGGGDATVRFWDTSMNLPRATGKGHRHHVLCTLWSPDGRRFISADKTGEMRVWDPEKGVELCQPLRGHKSWVTSMAFEPLHRYGGEQPYEVVEFGAKLQSHRPEIQSVSASPQRPRTAQCVFGMFGRVASSFPCR